MYILQTYIDTYLYKMLLKKLVSQVFQFALFSLLFLFYSFGNVFIWNTKLTEQLFKS